MTVTEYVAAESETAQARLRELRAAVQAAASASDESISYGVPTYRLNGRAIAHVGAAKRHCALHGAVSSELEGELRGYRVLKGTVQLPLDKLIPEELVQRIVLARLAEGVA